MWQWFDRVSQPRNADGVWLVKINVVGCWVSIIVICGVPLAMTLNGSWFKGSVKEQLQFCKLQNSNFRKTKFCVVEGSEFKN